MISDPAAFIRSQTKVTESPFVPEVKLHLADEITPLWLLTEKEMAEKDLAPPFWAFAWPGGQGVARYILDHADWIAGKHVLDFAAGCGIAAIAAMKAGAKAALAVDIDPLSVEAIGLNAALNDVIVDVRRGLDLSKPYKKADVIFAGDICYQQAMSTTLLRWLRLCVEAGVLVVLSDPGRAYVPDDGLDFLTSYDVPTSLDLEEMDHRTVSLWRMCSLAPLG